MRTLKTNPILKLINSYIVDSSQPANLSFMWNFGSLLAFSLIIQIITGVTLAMHYNANTLEAFNSVEHIMRDVNNGWLIRYLHSNTASAFFFIVYLHVGRGLYYGSYKAPRTLVWTIGTVIFILMIATAFLGYVLPYGQMSLWGATVITSLMSAIPWVGQDIVEFIWGGFSVNNATLNRFFALHFVLPFVLAALALMHLIVLHDRAGSGNPLGITGASDRVPFAPYYIFKDLITIFIFILGLSVLVFYMPNILGDSENYVMANSMQTPSAIVPEWYLLPFYAILRSIPNKLLGVIAMFSAILILLIMPFTDLSRSRGIQFRPLSKVFFFIFVANFLILLQLGAEHVESPFIEFGQISTVLYFAHFLVIIPIASLIENSLVELFEEAEEAEEAYEESYDQFSFPTYMTVQSFLPSFALLTDKNRTEKILNELTRDDSMAAKRILQGARPEEAAGWLEEALEARGESPVYNSDSSYDSENLTEILNKHKKGNRIIQEALDEANEIIKNHEEETKNPKTENNPGTENNPKSEDNSKMDIDSEDSKSESSESKVSENKGKGKGKDDDDNGNDGKGGSGGGPATSRERNTKTKATEGISVSAKNAFVGMTFALTLTTVLCYMYFDISSSILAIYAPSLANFSLQEALSTLTNLLLGKALPITLCDAPKPWGFYFQDSGTSQMEALVELHDNIMFYLVIILFGVGWILVSIVNVYNNVQSPISLKYLSHGASIELIWTVTPAIILILIAFPSFKLLYLMDEVSDPAMVVLAEGHQWYWSYQYADFMDIDEDFIEYDSYLVPESDLENGALRMLEVDNRLIIPELTHVRFIVGGADVIHSFACPALGIKCDAYPGRLNQSSIMINRAATFYGQCSEICGILHSSMPIVIESVSIERFLGWLLSQ